MNIPHVKMALAVLLSLLPFTAHAGTIRIYPAIELEFTTEPGQCYQIEYSSNLVTWSSLGVMVQGTGSNYNLLVSTKDTQRRFFRFAAMADTSPGLVALYRFNGDAADCSTNGNHGIVYNATLTTNRFGKANAAYRFAGTIDSYIRVPNSPSLEITNTITLAAWINFEVGGTYSPRIINKYSYELDTTEAFRSTRRLAFNLYSPALAGAFSSTEILQAGRWHFVAATYDGTLMLVYVDSALVGANVATGGMTDWGLDVNIGRNTQNFSDNYKGLIDDVRIYNRALSGAEITALYHEQE